MNKSGCNMRAKMKRANFKAEFSKKNGKKQPKACIRCVQLTPKIWHYYDVPNLLHGWTGGPLSITITDLICPIIGFTIRKHP